MELQRLSSEHSYFHRLVVATLNDLSLGHVYLFVALGQHMQLQFVVSLVFDILFCHNSESVELALIITV